jgi:hypothetical protein
MNRKEESKCHVKFVVEELTASTLPSKRMKVCVGHASGQTYFIFNDSLTFNDTGPDRRTDAKRGPATKFVVAQRTDGPSERMMEGGRRTGQVDRCLPSAVGCIPFLSSTQTSDFERIVCTLHLSFFVVFSSVFCDYDL